MEQSGKMYLLPGEECMIADKGCRGFLEGSFRWVSCFITIPIRIVLSAWPKSAAQVKSTADGLSGISMYHNEMFII